MTDAENQKQLHKIEQLLSLIDKIPARDKDLLLRNLVRTEFEVVLWYSADDTLRYVSESCSSILGVNAQGLMRDADLLLRRIHPDDRRLWCSSYNRASHDEILVRIKTPRGEYELFEHRCLTLWDEGGNEIGHIGNLVNITRRRAEYGDASVLALGVEKNPLGIVVTDAAGVICYANPAYNGIKECFAPNSVVCDVLPLLAQENRSEYAEMWQALDRCKSWQGCLKCPGPRDVNAWVNVNISPVLDADCEVWRYVAIVDDITETLVREKHLKQQHQELTQALARLERVKRKWEKSFDCIDQVIVIIDGQGRIRRINTAIAGVYGYNAQDLDMAPLAQVLPAELASAISDDEAGEFHDKNLDRWFNWRRFPFERDEENGQWYIVTLHDVSDIHRVTAELSEAYATQKATQSKLVQQEKMASIGQLAAGVAHEINNPVGFVASNLNTLKKYVQYLCAHITTLEHGIASSADSTLHELSATSRKENRVRMVEEDILELLEESLDGTVRVKNIVSNLKSFSRVDDDGKSWSDLKECLESSINIAWNEIKYHAQVKRDFGDLPLVFCSAQQMNQVFLNLLVNAAQAIEKHGIITVTTYVDDPWAVVQITDTGCGIAPEQLDKIFDPFYTTKEAGKGTGLGLSLCYDLVHNHGGDLTVKSVVGKGSTFEIRLPLYPPEGDGTEDAEVDKP